MAQRTDDLILVSIQEYINGFFYICTRKQNLEVLRLGRSMHSPSVCICLGILIKWS